MAWTELRERQDYEMRELKEKLRRASELISDVYDELEDSYSERGNEGGGSGGGQGYGGGGSQGSYGERRSWRIEEEDRFDERRRRRR